MDSTQSELTHVCDKTIDIQLTVTHHDESFSEHHREVLNWGQNLGMVSYQWCLGVHLASVVLKIVGVDNMQDMVTCLQEAEKDARRGQHSEN